MTKTNGGADLLDLPQRISRQDEVFPRMSAANPGREVAQVLIRLGASGFQQFVIGESAIASFAQVVVVLRHDDGILNLSRIQAETVGQIFSHRIRESMLSDDS